MIILTFKKCRLFSVLQEYMHFRKYPMWTPITRVIDGGETPIFKQFFSTWKEPESSVGIGRMFSKKQIAGTFFCHLSIISGAFSTFKFHLPPPHPHMQLPKLRRNSMPSRYIVRRGVCFLRMLGEPMASCPMTGPVK